MAYGCSHGLAQSVAYLHKLGVENIAAHNLGLAGRLLQALHEFGAEGLSPRNPAEKTSIVSARFPGIESTAIVSGLSKANIIISPRRDFFRFSPHLYNTADDIDEAIEALKALI